MNIGDFGLWSLFEGPAIIFIAIWAGVLGISAFIGSVAAIVYLFGRLIAGFRWVKIFIWGTHDNEC